MSDQAFDARHIGAQGRPLPGAYRPQRAIIPAALATMCSVTKDFFATFWQRARWAGLAWVMAVLTLLQMPAAMGQVSMPPSLTELRAERTPDGLYLSTQLQFQLSAAVEEALYKGIPVYFIAEVEIVRERWYWSDALVASASRYMRLSYQPLTRRWRFSSSSEPLTNAGLGVNFGQYYDSLSEAMTAVQRISQWKVAETSDLEGDARQTLRFRFRLDSSQLPRTFQLGALGQSDWALSIERQLDLTTGAGK